MELKDRSIERRQRFSAKFLHNCRRKLRERRRFGFISNQKLYFDTSYHAVESSLIDCQSRTLVADEVLLFPYQENDYIFLIKSGEFKVKLTNCEEEDGFLISAGEFFGELSVLDNQLVSAYVIATKCSEVLQLHKDLFFHHLKNIPSVAFNVIRLQSQRLRDLNELTINNQQHVLVANALDASNVAYWSWNMQTDITYSNEIFLNMLGYSQGDLENTRQSWINLIHTEDTNNFFSDKYKVLPNDLRSHTLEFRMRHQNGEWLWIKSIAKVLDWDVSGNPVRMSGIHQDISDKKLGLIQLQNAKNEAVIANDAKNHFIAGLSHELKTPLNAIIGFSQLMQEDATLSESHKEDVAVILNAGRHILELINDILGLSRLENEHSTQPLSPVAISPIIEDCLSILLPKINDRQIKVVKNKTSFEGVYVMALSRQLKQIILNLLSNAIKYNQDAGEIDIFCEVTSKNRVKLTIKDTGLGLTEKQVERLFIPFERIGRENSTIEGTGLGLSITKKLVDVIGGKIGVISNDEEGSSFWVEFEQAQALKNEESE